MAELQLLQQDLDNDTWRSAANFLHMGSFFPCLPKACFEEQLRKLA
jgi:hypothetical protein